MWLIPLGYTLRSLVNLFTMPKEFFRIALNKQQRRNHALEHATVNVIEEAYGPTNLGGFATDDGFIIRGIGEPDLIYSSALMGLERLQNGEKHLAIHKRCGTSLAASNLLASVFFILILLISGAANLWTMLLALLVGSAIGSRLGPLIQRYITTSDDVKDVDILGYEVILNGVHIYTRHPSNEYIIK